MGNDVAAPTGSPILAPFDGYAISYWNHLGGLSVKVYGARGYIYNAHLSAVGTLGRVRAGQVVGYIGSTGDATGPHDHVEWHPGDGARGGPLPGDVGRVSAGLAPDLPDQAQHLEVDPDQRREQSERAVPRHVRRRRLRARPSSMNRKSTSRNIAATMQITTEIAMPIGDGELMNGDRDAEHATGSTTPGT